MLKYNVETYCGGFCGACPIFMKTKDGTINELAAKWGVKVDDIICYGCKSGHVAKQWCRNCFIKTCCQTKDIDSCIECNIYPCKDLVTFQNDKKHPHHSEHHDLLALIKNEGMEVWLHTCKTRWTCSSCKSPFNWDQKKCDTCGEPVDGYGLP